MKKSVILSLCFFSILEVDASVNEEHGNLCSRLLYQLSHDMARFLWGANNVAFEESVASAKTMVFSRAEWASTMWRHFHDFRVNHKIPRMDDGSDLARGWIQIDRRYSQIPLKLYASWREAEERWLESTREKNGNWIGNQVRDDLRELIDLRNQVARSAGFKNFFEWRLSELMGFPKAEIERLRNQLKDRIDRFEREVAPGELISVQGPLFKRSSPKVDGANLYSVIYEGLLSLGMDFSDSFVRLDVVSSGQNKSHDGVFLTYPSYIDEYGRYSKPSIAWKSSVPLLDSTESLVAGVGSLFEQFGAALYYSHARGLTPLSHREYPFQRAVFTHFLSQFLGDPLWIKSADGKLFGRDLTSAETLRWLLIVQSYQLKRLKVWFDAFHLEEAIYGGGTEDLDQSISRLLIQNPDLNLAENLHSVLSEPGLGWHWIPELVAAELWKKFSGESGSVLGRPFVGMWLQERLLEDIQDTPPDSWMKNLMNAGFSDIGVDLRALRSLRSIRGEWHEVMQNMRIPNSFVFRPRFRSIGSLMFNGKPGKGSQLKDIFSDIQNRGAALEEKNP